MSTTPKQPDKVTPTTAENTARSSLMKIRNSISKKDKEKDAKVKAEPKTEVYSSKKSEDKVITLTDKEQFETILTEAGDKVIMVEFFATWCGPCRLLSIKLEELAKLYMDKAIMVKIDVDDFEDLAVEYNITSMPAFMIMKNKQQLYTFFGSKVELLENALEKYVGKPGDKLTKKSNEEEVKKAGDKLTKKSNEEETKKV